MNPQIAALVQKLRQMEAELGAAVGHAARREVARSSRGHMD